MGAAPSQILLEEEPERGPLSSGNLPVKLNWTLAGLSKIQWPWPAWLLCNRNTLRLAGHRVLRAAACASGAFHARVGVVVMLIERLAAKEVAMAPRVHLGALVKERIFGRQLRGSMRPDHLQRDRPVESV